MFVLSIATFIYIYIYIYNDNVKQKMRMLEGSMGIVIRELTVNPRISRV